MVGTCCAVNCDNKSVAGNGITFHRFPLRNKELLAKWVQAVKRLNWKPTKWSVLCSEHFSKYDFYPDQSIKRLRENVIPTIFSHRPAVKKRPPPKNRQPVEVSVSSTNVMVIEVEHINVDLDYTDIIPV